MKKRKIYLASFFVALFLLVLTGCSQKSQEIPTKKVTVSLSNTKTIPTFFFHGWGSSINACFNDGCWLYCYSKYELAVCQVSKIYG